MKASLQSLRPSAPQSACHSIAATPLPPLFSIRRYSTTHHLAALLPLDLHPPRILTSTRRFTKGFGPTAMAARLAQLRAKAAQASELVVKHGGAYYKEVMEKNK